MDFLKTQELLLKLLPLWQNKIVRPFKQILDDGITPEMYNCMQFLLWFDDGIAMTELSKTLRLPKQRMTKLADRLVREGFAARGSDSADRRIIRLALTDKARRYLEGVLSQDIESYKENFKSLDPQEMEEFQSAVETLFRILSKDLPN